MKEENIERKEINGVVRVNFESGTEISIQTSNRKLYKLLHDWFEKRTEVEYSEKNSLMNTFYVDMPNFVRIYFDFLKKTKVVSLSPIKFKLKMNFVFEDGYIVMQTNNKILYHELKKFFESNLLKGMEAKKEGVEGFVVECKTYSIFILFKR
ncbi:MAG: hypothetical protein QXL51_06215 [Candidatus Aenigmatarchaeota archaeon]